MLYSEQDPLINPMMAAEDDPPMLPLKAKNTSSSRADVLTESSLSQTLNQNSSKITGSVNTTHVTGIHNKILNSNEGTIIEKAEKKKKSAKLIMCVLNTKYTVVKHVGKKTFKFKLTKDEDTEWDLCWQDGSVTPEQLGKMKPYQKINHFPGMYGLARKDYLGRNLMRMRKLLPDVYKFFPKTWMLPAEWLDFSKQFNGKRTFILKPEASCQGRGIFLTKRIEDIKPDHHYVAQKYLLNPYLIDGLKFDMRVYVLLYGCDPIRIFLYHEGLARFATEEYKKPGQGNITDVCMHLTNYAINKNSEKFIFNEDANKQDVGHKRNLESVWKHIDKTEGAGRSEKVKAEIEDIIIKTVCAVQPSLAHLYKSCMADDIDNSCCFEVLGFDIILDYKLKPWLLEVNHSPSFTTDTPFDWKIKSELISDTLTILNITEKKKKLYLQRKRKELQKRMFTKTPKDSIDDRIEYKAKKMRIRHKYEINHLGGFKLIYPVLPTVYPNNHSELIEKYKLCLEKANEVYLAFMGGMKKGEMPEKPLMAFGAPIPQMSVKSEPINKEKSITSTQNTNLSENDSISNKLKAAIVKRKTSMTERNNNIVKRPATVKGPRRIIQTETMIPPKEEKSLIEIDSPGTPDHLKKIQEPKVFANFCATSKVQPPREIKSQSLFRPPELQMLIQPTVEPEQIQRYSYVSLQKTKQDKYAKKSNIHSNYVAWGKQRFTGIGLPQPDEKQNIGMESVKGNGMLSPRKIMTAMGMFHQHFITQNRKEYFFVFHLLNIEEIIIVQIILIIMQF